MKGKTSRSLVKNLLFMFIPILLALAGGIILFFTTEYYKNVFLAGGTLEREFLKLAVVFISIFVSLYIQIIIHEGGHLIFGLLSGYTFVSFRFGSATLVKDEGKWRIKKFSLPGTGGQCLMMPPEGSYDKVPFVLYNLGGAIINLIAGMVSILLVYMIKDMDIILKISLLVFGVIGILYACLNGIPLRYSGISNDGSNLVALIKDKEARKAFYLQLRVNGLATAGQRPKEWAISELELKEGADMANPMFTAIVLMRYNHYLDNMEFEKCKEILDSLKPYMNKMLGVYKYGVQCERVFLELVLKGDKSLVENIYDKALVNFMKACKGMIDKKRVKMAYELLYNKDIEKANKIYEEAKATADKYPVKGEKIMEIMLMEYLKTLEFQEENKVEEI